MSKILLKNSVLYFHLHCDKYKQEINDVIQRRSLRGSLRYKLFQFQNDDENNPDFKACMEDEITIKGILFNSIDKVWINEIVRNILAHCAKCNNIQEFMVQNILKNIEVVITIDQIKIQGITPIDLSNVHDLRQHITIFAKSWGNLIEQNINTIIDKIQEYKLTQLVRIIQHQSSVFQQNQLKQPTYQPYRIRIAKILYGNELCCQPNQDIIIGCLSSAKVPCSNKYTIWYNMRNNYQFDSMRIHFNVDEAKYEGNIDEYHKPLGKGRMIFKNTGFEYCGNFIDGLFDGTSQIFNHANNEIFLEGQFEKGQLHGYSTMYTGDLTTTGQYLFNQRFGNHVTQYKNSTNITSQFYIRNELASYQEYRIPTNQPSVYVSSFSNLYLTLNNDIRTLYSGKWLQSRIVDYYLALIVAHMNIIHPQDSKQLNVLDTSKSQDIFGSMITLGSQINRSTSSRFINLQASRTVFVLNIDQGHFICAVYDKSELYVLDSLGGQQQYLLMKLNDYLGINKQWRNILNISQQANAYDCGVYTCYNALQLIRNINTPIEQINFKVSPKQINTFRRKLYNITVLNYSHIMNVDAEF